MITQLWITIMEVITGLIGALVAGFEGITEIFYKTGEEAGFTVIGQLLLIGLGMTIVFFAFRFIKNLVRK